MKFRLSHLFLIIAFIACFLAGWVAHSTFASKSPFDTQRIDGSVVSIGEAGNLVEINIGDDDGIQPGQPVRFYRHSKEVGWGLVGKSTANSSTVALSGMGGIAPGDEARLMLKRTNSN